MGHAAFMSAWRVFPARTLDSDFGEGWLVTVRKGTATEEVQSRNRALSTSSKGGEAGQAASLARSGSIATDSWILAEELNPS